MGAQELDRPHLCVRRLRIVPPETNSEGIVSRILRLWVGCRRRLTCDVSAHDAITGARRSARARWRVT
jgi:hypothetical protein